MKIAIVCQRFGQEVIGGAEHHAWQVAEKLQSLAGHSVEILTTRARSARTWQNAYPPGPTATGGFCVRRFSTRFPRLPWVFSLYHRLVWRHCRQNSSRLTSWLEWIWYILQGPYSPALVRYIRDHQQKYDQIIFFTYLYYPTVFGLPLVAGKALLIPTCHDEPPFYFPKIQKNFALCKRILVNSASERALLCQMNPQLGAKIRICGVGIDLPRVDPTLRPYPHGYLVVVGRINRLKGSFDLVAMFAKLAKRLAQPLALVFIGPYEKKDRKNLEALAHTGGIGDRVLIQGVVSEADKLAWMAGSLALCNPSRLESLSLVVLESIALGIPVLVNQNCPVLNAYTFLPSVFAYQDADDFFRLVQSLWDKPWQLTAPEKLQAARDQLLQHFSWPAVLATFAEALN